MKGSASKWKDASFGSEKETFLTRFGGDWGGFRERSSKEQRESVGEDTRVSGVQARELTDPEGEWQLEPREEPAEPGRNFRSTESSAALMSAEARSKCVRACWRRLDRRAAVEGSGRAQISNEVAA
jgi:hypothetical protein